MVNLCWRSLKIYWKTLFMVVWPLVLLPLFVLPGQNTTEMRCMYVVGVMAGYWCLEILPLAITSLIPMVLFPLMGILDSKKTSIAYFKETNMMFVGGLIIALAVEFCNLHTRISLICIKFIGCSYRRLNLGLVTLTMLVSMWISNTAATAMMTPIIQAVLTELDSQGIGKMWEDQDESEELAQMDESSKRPTNVTICFYLSTAYAANIGGFGCIVGSGTNLVLKGIYESIFPSQTLSFTEWMFCNTPLMLCVMYPTWIWLQFLFMGLFRPNSKDAQAINVGTEGEKITRRVLTDKLEAMGPITFHEILVAIMFVLVALLWFFRRPGFMPGWPSIFTDMLVGDATAAMIVVLLLFMLPSTYDFIYMCSKDEDKRPSKTAQPLITWRYIHQKMHWSLILLLGGGFALADGIIASGMGKLVAEQLTALADMPPLSVLAIASLMVSLITQITTNVAIANIVLPIVANLAITMKVHPMYMMMPVSLSCSFSFCLPVSTPPNAIVAAPCNMRNLDMLKAAWMVQIICYVMLLAIFPAVGSLIWDFSTFPEWATHAPENTTSKPH